MSFIKLIENYKPNCFQEEIDKNRILCLYEKHGNKLLFRDCKEAHFSSSIIVFDESFEYVLFAFHNIYNSWAWLGGHVDGDEDFYHVAIKEMQEESGIKEFEPLSKGIISLEILPVKEHYKNGILVEEHVHLNVSYVFKANKNQIIRIKEDENSKIAWLKISELKNKCNEKNMIPIYEKIIKKVIKNV